MNQLDIYFNTTHEKGDQLKASRFKAGMQNAKILDMFTHYHYREFTPDEIWSYFDFNRSGWPLTSVRRAINTLTEEGFLEKLETKRMGMYGKLTHTWKLKPSKL
jgi:Fe2+ or Zn2+ uptake regulation protein